MDLKMFSTVYVGLLVVGSLMFFGFIYHHAMQAKPNQRINVTKPLAIYLTLMAVSVCVMLLVMPRLR